MAPSPAHIILDAAQACVEADISSLGRLVGRYGSILKLDLVLRILLTYLPESTEPALYVSFLRKLVNGELNGLDGPSLSDYASSQLSREEARSRVRKLRLLHLASSEESTQDVFTAFLIDRAYRIDEDTGSLVLVQQLIEPFLGHSDDLRSWAVGVLLPLVRLNYEYYPEIKSSLSLDGFQQLQSPSALDTLLSQATTEREKGSKSELGRDFRGLVGPWAHGEISRKKRKLNHHRSSSEELPQNADEKASLTCWGCVNDWLLDRTARSFSFAVDTFEQWGGPRDIDYGGWLSDDQKLAFKLDQPTKAYAQAGLAALYTTSGDTLSTYEGMHKILSRIAHLDNLPKPLALGDTASLLAGNSSADFIASLVPSHILATNLRDAQNPLTTPTKDALRFASILLAFAYAASTLGQAQSLKNVLALCIFGAATDQRMFLGKLLSGLNSQNMDDAAWADTREKILWLRGGPNPGSTVTTVPGPLFKINPTELELQILQTMVSAARYRLAVGIYCNQEFQIVPREEVEQAVLEVALSSYDNASNGNKTRGGVKKAADILAAFRDNFIDSSAFNKVLALIQATHSLSFYSLTLQHGVPFQPVNIRVRSDPLGLIDKILVQNPRSYTKLDDLLDIGQNLVRAGLIKLSDASGVALPGLPQDALNSIVERHITAKAIEAALAGDDFDTAYSYVVNRLSALQPKQQDGDEGPGEDVLWRAAYQAGRYQSKKVNDASRLRRLEQRMELLSKALLLAPSASLTSVLATWRSCEEEVNRTLAEETEAEERWDDHGDRNVPGGFGQEPLVQTTQKPRESTWRAINEEAPIGLFDVARGAAAALSKSAFPLRAGRTELDIVGGADEARLHGSLDSIQFEHKEDSEGRIRKRDLVRNTVAGGLASGIGWVLGTPPVRQE